MWIMIAGQYRSGSDNPDVWEQNLALMNAVAYQVFLKGHTHIIGVNLALPIIQTAGMERYEQLMMPISLAAAERCDAAIRIGGPSKGADMEVDLFRSRGLPVYASVENVPLVEE